MKTLILLLVTLMLKIEGYGQTVVFDREHFSIVNQNGAARLSSELLIQNSYQRIAQRMDDIKVNMAALVLTHQLIYRSLVQVDQGFRSALVVRELSTLLSEIYLESAQMVSFAEDHPHLLLFAEKISTQLRARGANLVSEVSSSILAEKGDLLMDIQKRDALLQKISLELKVIRALVFSMRKSMFWASQRSIFSQLNPYRNFVNSDKKLVEQIINGYKNMKK